jgi:hypothetical protein
MSIRNNITGLTKSIHVECIAQSYFDRDRLLIVKHIDKSDYVLLLKVI